jgi:hypothetical protein
MRMRIGAGLAAVAAGLAVLTGGANYTPAQEKKAAPAKFLYTYDLISRQGGAKDINDKTPRVGVEFFQDDALKVSIAISEAGRIAVSPAKDLGAKKEVDWKTGFDLAVRKAGESGFTQKTAKFGVEVFDDHASDRLLYLGQSGAVTFAPRPTQATAKGPKFHHGLEPKVRAPDQEEFTDAKRFGVEVYADLAHDRLLYVTEAGGLAAAPAAPPLAEGAKVKDPVPQYGLVLRVRKADEKDFGPKTKKYGVEVFEDPNANVLFYLSETGSIAVVPKPAKFEDGGKGVLWKGAMNLKARKAGEKEFDKAQRFGIEAFQDNRTGNLVFITDTGSIAVLPAAK